MAKQPELKIRFHNPNPPDVTVDYILKLCIEAGKKKLDREIQKVSENAIAREGSQSA